MGIKTVIGMDPGTHNFAFTVIQYKDGKRRLIDAGMIQNTILNLTHPLYRREQRLFLEEIDALLNKYRPDLVIMERFQNRGRTGKTIECVNVMIGLISIKMLEKRFLLVVASQWKNQFNRQSPIPLKVLYSVIKKATGCPNHVVDAFLINMYGNSKISTYFNFNENLMIKNLSKWDWRTIIKSLDSFFKGRPK